MRAVQTIRSGNKVIRKPKMPVLGSMDAILNTSKALQEQSYRNEEKQPSDTFLSSDSNIPMSSADALQLFTNSTFAQDALNQSTLQQQSIQISDKQNICLDILCTGHVNSFVDFFYLTHRTEEENNRTLIPDNKLLDIKHDLTVAESSHRHADYVTVFESYEHLASYFYSVHDYKTAIYFYEKCLDIGEDMQDIVMQCHANLHLGITHDSMGDISTAIKFHEKHANLAHKLQDLSRIQQANHQLIEAYRRFAEEYERKDDYQNAVIYYKKCLGAAIEGNDIRSEGLATYRLGVTCAALGDRNQSIEFQQRYLNICKKTGDQLGEGQACAALAQSFKELGETKLAIDYLKKYEMIAIRNKQSTNQAEACAALGSIYSAAGDHTGAVSCFEKTFDIARNVGDRKLVDNARIHLGMARGNMALTKYMQVVKENLPALLNWKTRRVAFQSEQTTNKK